MNVSVAEVLAGAAVRAVPLSAECAGYLVLAAADQVAAAPRRVEAGDVLLGEDGAIRVTNGRAAEGDVAEGDLRAVLDALLLRASAPTAGLLRASRRAAGAGVEALVRELETALIPVNRAAARRSLARLERETLRALESGRIDVSAARPSVPAPKPVEARASVAELVETPASPPAIASQLAQATREPSVAPPPAKPAVERTERLVRQERTAVVARVAPKPQAPKPQDDSDLVETRPEPVVKRASMRPSAPPSTPVLPPVSLRAPEFGGAFGSLDFETSAPVREAVAPQPQQTEPLPLPKMKQEAEVAQLVLVPHLVMVDVESHPNVTPFLGTRVNAEPAPSGAPEGGAETRGAVEGTRGAVEETCGAVEETRGAVEETRLTESADPAAAVASAVLQVMAPFADDGDVEIIEVIFDPHEHAVVPHAEELIYAQGGDWTEPCPPLELEAAPEPTVVECAPGFVVTEPALGIAEHAPNVVEDLQNVVEYASNLPAVELSVVQGDSSIDEALDAAFAAALIDGGAVAEPQTFAVCSPGVPGDVPCESDDILSVDISVLCQSANMPYVAVDAAPVAVDAAPVAVDAAPVAVDAAPVAVESELPPWATSVAEAQHLTPPPRLALPVEHPSDVDDLLRRLDEMPLALDDVRAGLKRLAGMEPTPPPPGVALDP